MAKITMNQTNKNQQINILCKSDQNITKTNVDTELCTLQIIFNKKNILLIMQLWIIVATNSIK